VYGPAFQALAVGYIAEKSRGLAAVGFLPVSRYGAYFSLGMSGWWFLLAATYRPVLLQPYRRAYTVTDLG
jgi:hypothetical protein